MKHYKTVTEQTNTQDEAEFVLELSPEQYEIYELLAKIDGQEDDMLAYIHRCINVSIFGSADYIRDEKQRKQAKAEFKNWQSSASLDQVVVLRGMYTAPAVQMKVIADIAKGLGYSNLNDFLQWATRSGAKADIAQLTGFEGADTMAKMLEEKEA